MSVYNQLKARGLPDDQIQITMKYKFIDQKNLLYAACAQGQQHLNDVSQQIIDAKSLIETFTNKPGNEIFKPYFNDTDKYESEVKLDLEDSFLDTAQQVLNMYRNFKSNHAKKFNADVSKCVTMLSNIITEPPSLTE